MDIRRPTHTESHHAPYMLGFVRVATLVCLSEKIRHLWKYCTLSHSLGER